MFRMLSVLQSSRLKDKHRRLKALSGKLDPYMASSTRARDEDTNKPCLLLLWELERRMALCMDSPRTRIHQAIRTSDFVDRYTHNQKPSIIQNLVNQHPKP